MNKRALTVAIVSVTLLLVVVFVTLSFVNSEVVESVSIKIRSGVTERKDHAPLGMGKKHELPDYKVKLLVTKRFLSIDLGTRLNTSAAEWIEYRVTDTVPTRNLQEIIVIEDDRVENDVLDRIPYRNKTGESTSFEYKVQTTRTFEQGMNYFFKTPLGKAISAGIILGIVALFCRFRM